MNKVNEKKPLIIIGASGFGKEVAWLASDCGVSVRGFLDDDESLLGVNVNGINVLGGIKTAKENLDAQFIVAVGSPSIRKEIVDMLKDFGVSSFAILIHPLVQLSSFVDIGEGSLVCAGGILTVNIRVGEHCHINLSSTVGHDSVIGDYCTLAPQSIVSGNVEIRAGVEIGTGASIRQGCTLAEGSMIGMGAVLTKHTEENTIYIGNPAKPLKKLNEFK